jgi:hypothetical protein
LPDTFIGQVKSRHGSTFYSVADEAEEFEILGTTYFPVSGEVGTLTFSLAALAAAAVTSRAELLKARFSELYSLSVLR